MAPPWETREGPSAFCGVGCLLLARIPDGVPSCVHAARCSTAGAADNGSIRLCLATQRGERAAVHARDTPRDALSGLRRVAGVILCHPRVQVNHTMPRTKRAGTGHGRRRKGGKKSKNAYY